jgi:hypothetical protein
LCTKGKIFSIKLPGLQTFFENCKNIPKGKLRFGCINYYKREFGWNFLNNVV